MDDLAQKRYDEDKREPCKYGKNCFRKNQGHIKKFKHPPFKNTIQAEPPSPPKKRLKLQNLVEDEPEVPKPSVSKEKDLSDSELFLEEIDEIQPKEVLDLPENEDVEIDSSDLTPHEYIKKHFLVEMPDEFYKFWEFCESVNPKNPLEAFSVVGLSLVGPFDVLAGKFKNISKKPEVLLRHWRYYYDPPEMQTILSARNQDGFHIGYYRDIPEENPCFVCSGTLKDGTLTIMAENLFGAIMSYLSKYRASVFEQSKIAGFKKKFSEFATQWKISISTSSNIHHRRKGKSVTKLFNGINLHVPFDSKTKVGYRDLTETPANIKKTLENIVEATTPEERDDFFAKLQPVIQWANVAADECDFGTTLELGLDLFIFGGDVFHNLVRDLLTSSYSLLNRNAFGKIIVAHLEDRRKGNNLSILSR